METNTAMLPTAMLGFWVKCVRKSMNWSQEAVAEASGVTVRTVQRIEAGEPSSVSTRRSLARGLGYDNHGIFDTPDFAMSVHKILSEIGGANQEAMEKQFPDRITLPAERIKGGDALGRIADISNGLVLHMDDEISQGAKETAAALFDYLRDLSDIRDDLSFTDKLSYSQEMGTMFGDLEANGATAYSAVRKAQFVGNNWPDKTPMAMTIVYVTVVPIGKSMTEMTVPRRLSR